MSNEVAGGEPDVGALWKAFGENMTQVAQAFAKFAAQMNAVSDALSRKALDLELDQLDLNVETDGQGEL